IQGQATTNAVTVLGPGGVGFAGERFTIDVSGGTTVSFAEVGTGSTARDLGLATDAGFAFDAANTDGVDLDPKLTLRSSVASLAGLTGPLDEIESRNAGRLARVDLTGAATIEDIKNRIETAGTGVRIEINEAGTGIDVVNLVSAEPDQSLSISEVAGGEETANLLGIRTFGESTRIDRLNDGRGVRVLSGRTDPETGLAAPELDIDFEIGLGDGSAITIDLRPQDLTNAGTLVARINAEAANQGIAPGDFQAQLGNGDRGLVFTQNPAFAGDITVSQRNNSQAAFDLGILGGEYDAASATFAGEDRAQVVTDTVFTRLIQLRDALLADDTSGITLAGEKLEGVVDSVAQTRGLVGSYGQRLDNARAREEDGNLLEQSVRSELRDVDLAEAATRLTSLQTQLEAGLRSTSIAGSLSLLDFI
ncbi:MAG: flagellin, partial [Planctomycetota bacterium]